MQYNVTTIIDEKPLVTIQNFIEYVDKNIDLTYRLESHLDQHKQGCHIIQVISMIVRRGPLRKLEVGI